MNIRGRIFLCFGALNFLSLSSGIAGAQHITFTSPAGGETWYRQHHYDVCWTRTVDVLPVLMLSIEQASGEGARTITYNAPTGLSECFNWGVYYDLPQVPHRFCLRGTVSGAVHKECSQSVSILAPAEIHIDNVSIEPRPRHSSDRIHYKAKIIADGPDKPENVSVRFQVFGPGRTQLFDVEKTYDFSERSYYWFGQKYRVPQWGLYRNELSVDTEEVVYERDESNNEKVTLYAVDPLPDLQVYVKPDIPSVAIFRRREIRAYVKNVGERRSPEAELRFRISGKGENAYTVPALDPGKKWSIARKPKWSTGGMRSFEVRVYPQGPTGELDDDNNHLKGHVFVRGVPIEFDESGIGTPPDIRVRGWIPKSMQRNKNTPIMLEVKNLPKNGRYKADGVKLTMTLHRPGTEPGQGHLVETFDIPELLPGEKHIIVHHIKTAKPATSRQYLTVSATLTGATDINPANNSLERYIDITN